MERNVENACVLWWFVEIAMEFIQGPQEVGRIQQYFRYQLWKPLSRVNPFLLRINTFETKAVGASSTLNPWRSQDLYEPNCALAILAMGTRTFVNRKVF